MRLPFLPLLNTSNRHVHRQQGANPMNNPNTLNPAVLTETLSVRLPLDFIKALIVAARAKNVTLSHHVRNILEISTAVKSA
jgi:hypothetical protein